MFSFEIIAENFEIFENDIFDCKVLWMSTHLDARKKLTFVFLCLRF